MSRFKISLKWIAGVFAVIVIAAGALFATQNLVVGNPDPMEQVVPLGPAQSDLLTTLEFNPEEAVKPTNVLHSCGAWRCGGSFFGFRRCCRSCRELISAPGRGGREIISVPVEICRTFWSF